MNRLLVIASLLLVMLFSTSCEMLETSEAYLMTYSVATVDSSPLRVTLDSIDYFAVDGRVTAQVYTDHFPVILTYESYNVPFYFLPPRSTIWITATGWLVSDNYQKVIDEGNW